MGVYLGQNSVDMFGGQPIEITKAKLLASKEYTITEEIDAVTDLEEVEFDEPYGDGTAGRSEAGIYIVQVRDKNGVRQDHYYGCDFIYPQTRTDQIIGINKFCGWSYYLKGANSWTVTEKRSSTTSINGIMPYQMDTRNRNNNMNGYVTVRAKSPSASVSLIGTYVLNVYILKLQGDDFEVNE